MRIIAYAGILASYASLVAGEPQFGGMGKGGKLGGGGKFGGKVNCQGDMAGGLSSLGGVTKYRRTDNTGGSGPYKAYFTTDPSLRRHTIYMPTKVPSGLKMPVVVWGNGACYAKGTMFINMLIEWASHGIMVIANGEPNGKGSETAQWDTEAINWALRNAGKGKYAQATASRIGVAGQSCGGLEAYTASRHANVTSIGIFNSGALNAAQKPIAKAFRKPVAYFLGGPSDIAYRQGESDYRTIPATTPRWKGNIGVGHFGTYCVKNGGAFGRGGSHWWRWTLRGDETAKSYFTARPNPDGWQAVSGALDRIKVLPMAGNEGGAGASAIGPAAPRAPKAPRGPAAKESAAKESAAAEEGAAKEDSDE